MSEPQDDPIDRDLAEGFAHLRPPEELVSRLLTADHGPAAPATRAPNRTLSAVLLAAAVAAVALLVLGRPADVPSNPPPDAPAAPLVIPDGMRAVTLPVVQELMGDDDATGGAVIDLISLQDVQTITLLRDVLVLSASDDAITIACSPQDAEKVVLALDSGPLVPSFHAGSGMRRITIPVLSAPIDAGWVQRGMRTDLLATLHTEGKRRTLTFLTDVAIEHVYDDGRLSIRVRPDEAERVLHMVEQGPIALSLRGG